MATVSPSGGLTTTGGGGNPALGVLWPVVLGPLLLFLYTLVYRVIFELIIVVFRIFENTRDQPELARATSGPRFWRPPSTGGPSQRRSVNFLR